MNAKCIYYIFAKQNYSFVFIFHGFKLKQYKSEKRAVIILSCICLMLNPKIEKTLTPINARVILKNTY